MLLEWYYVPISMNSQSKHRHAVLLFGLNQLSQCYCKYTFSLIIDKKLSVYRKWDILSSCQWQEKTYINKNIGTPVLTQTIILSACHSDCDSVRITLNNN